MHQVVNFELKEITWKLKSYTHTRWALFTGFDREANELMQFLITSFSRTSWRALPAFMALLALGLP